MSVGRSAPNFAPSAARRWKRPCRNSRPTSKPAAVPLPEKAKTRRNNSQYLTIAKGTDISPCLFLGFAVSITQLFLFRDYRFLLRLAVIHITAAATGQRADCRTF